MKKLTWQCFEEEVFDLIRKQYPNAILLGSHDSTKPDVQIGPDYIDIKMPLAQCGQSTNEDEFIFMQQNPRQWVQDYYENKNVVYWATKIKNELILTPPANKDWIIQAEPSRNKRSGSRPLNKKHLQLAAETINAEIIESNNRYFVRGKYKNKQLFETSQITFLLSECGNDYFEVRIRGNTNTATQVMRCIYRGF